MRSESIAPMLLRDTDAISGRNDPLVDLHSSRLVRPW